jgi:hypothetical protein
LPIFILSIHFRQISPKTFRVIITIILCYPWITRDIFRHITWTTQYYFINIHVRVRTRILYYVLNAKQLSTKHCTVHINYLQIKIIIVLSTRIVLLLESLLWWWTELRTMLRHLNRRGSKRNHLSAFNSVQFTIYVLI